MLALLLALFDLLLLFLGVPLANRLGFEEKLELEGRQLAQALGSGLPNRPSGLTRPTRRREQPRSLRAFCDPRTDASRYEYGERRRDDTLACPLTHPALVLVERGELIAVIVCS